MFVYYKDLFGKLYLRKRGGPLKKLSTFSPETVQSSSRLRPPGGYKISQDIFFTEISDDEFFDACKCWGRKSHLG